MAPRPPASGPETVARGASAGQPPVRLVLVHGTRQEARMWDRYRALLPGLDLVAIDLPGHGTKADQAFTTAAAVDAMAEAVDRRAPGQPVVLVGHSLGGYMATVYAARHPQTLHHLVLVGATADPTHRSAIVYKAFAAALPLVNPARMAATANRLMVRLGADPALVPTGESYAALPAAWKAVFADCRPELLDRVDCPVTLVNGQFDQMRIHARAYAARCQSEVITVPRTTHLLPLTHPELLAPILARVADAAVAAASAGHGADGGDGDDGAKPTQPEANSDHRFG